MSEVEPIYEQIGARIRLAREWNGWNQSRLADEIGLTRASVTNVETGRQRIMLHQLEDVADVLGVPLTALIDPKIWSAVVKEMRPEIPNV